jgi:hypothetical protein
MPEQNSSISNFKRFLLKVLLPLILVLSVAGMAFAWYFENKIIFGSQICGAYKVNRILHEVHPDEIPIFGSSRAEGGYIPDSLGGNYFNYGLSGATYDVTLFFLQEECKKHKNTPWVLLNFDLYGLKYQLGDIANYIPNASNPDVRALLRDNYTSYYRIPVLKYYGRYETYFRDYVNNKMQLTKFTNKGASVEKNILTQKEFAQRVMERRNAIEYFRNDSTLEKKLISIIEAHPERMFLFVIAPYHNSYFEHFADEPKEKAFCNYLQSFKNVRLLDFGRMNLPDSMFFNTTHINLKGAIVFNRVLKDSLTAMGVH